MTAGYRLLADADLTRRNTFGVAVRAPLLVEVQDTAALPSLFANELAGTAPLVLGGGSNLLFAGDPDIPVLSIDAREIDILADEGDHTIVRADAGVEWHRFVMETLSRGLCGLENLALIPGTVGAAPIQNIGAYGVEVETRIHCVEAFERASGALQRLSPQDCAFAYRDSAFKRDPARWIVTAVEFNLTREAAPALDYAGLRDELAAMDIAAPNASQVAEAVIRIRRRKLPDPAVIGNAGSFFKNPIVPVALAEALQAEHPSLPMFPGSGADTRKLSAAWLIDRCGWKGAREGDAGVSEKHALVLVNHGHATGAQLLDLARRIAASVRERFGVSLEPEPRIVQGIWD
ncbi:UDP-N-acetylmuramate dehydrogenase [Luteimonas panaciterrae]|uniref:UDP-N-acetylmuramate dehydrogenase n=1 Tax=Luteimonas panaciterrae TaxID=363885 RepID=UPI001CFA9162|nr:UDP-N-acetylmuramate dehydrogenase [Luteimonas panaciterrae]